MRLFSVRACDGSLRRGCDAGCYDRPGKRCKCACGGVNHGVGLEQAIANTCTIYPELRRQFGEALQVDPALGQQQLPLA